MSKSRIDRTRAFLIEMLEPRCTPTTGLVENNLVESPVDDYQAWRSTRFSIETIEVMPSGQGKPTDVSAFPAPLERIPLAQVNQSNPTHSIIGLDRVPTELGLTGAGYSVAVIDTGIDYTHASLGAGWGNRVVGGYDFVERDNDPNDLNGHGTHVAGIIASSDSTWRGIVPDANLVALRVLDASGSGSFGDVEDALRWVMNNRDRFNIAAINLSLGSGNYRGNPYTFLEDEFEALQRQGVFITVASGNGFYTHSSVEGLSYPSVSPNVISVGAVWNGDYGSVTWQSGATDESTAIDRVVSFSQRGDALDLLAPGAFITSTRKGGGFARMAGTSMASPVVAGAAVVLHQAFDSLGQGVNATQSRLRDLFRSSARWVVDGDDERDNVVNTGKSYPRIDVAAALQSIAVVNPSVDLTGFNDLTDVVVPARLQPGPSSSVMFVNTGEGENSLLGFDPLTGITHLRQSKSQVNAWSGPNVVSLIGDVDGDGISDLVQLRKPTQSGTPTGSALQVIDLATGTVRRQIQYGEAVLDARGQTYATLLGGLVDAGDRAFVGHFTQKDHLELLLFNRTDVTKGAVALQTINLLTGQPTFRSLHDGNIFAGWTEESDEALVSDMNDDGFDDLVLINRVEDPSALRPTNKGFVGIVSIRSLGEPAGPYRGFYRFFDWNYTRPGENAVFPGYDDINDRAVAGFTLEGGNRVPVVLLVNSSVEAEAAYAVLRPRPLINGTNDAFQLISTIFHGPGTRGYFDADDTYLMADFDGDGQDEVASYSRTGSVIGLKVFSTSTGHPRQVVGDASSRASGVRTPSANQLATGNVNTDGTREVGNTIVMAETESRSSVFTLAVMDPSRRDIYGQPDIRPTLVDLVLSTEEVFDG